MKEKFQFQYALPERLDRVMQSFMPDDVSRSKITKWIREGYVSVNDETVTKAGMLINTGDWIFVDHPDETKQRLTEPVDMDLDVVFEDEYLAVINKPAGIAVHPAPSVKDATLVNALQFHFDSLSTEAGVERAGIVHRLDRETSGLMVVAKQDAVHVQLSNLFKSRKIVKIYKAIVYGKPGKPEDTLEFPIGRSRTDRKKMAVSRDGRSAVTSYKVVEQIGMFSVVNVSLETGRTHQIRVHLTHIGHPLVGDKLYGSGRWKGVENPELRSFLRKFPRHALHSALLRFHHPVTGVEIICKRPFPPDLTMLLETIKKYIVE